MIAITAFEINVKCWHMSAHVGTYQHMSACQNVLTHASMQDKVQMVGLVSEVRRVVSHVGTCRHMSAHVGTYQDMSAFPPVLTHLSIWITSK